MPKKQPPGQPASSLPYPDSLCHRCQAKKYVPTPRSMFIMCTVLPLKYPPQPVAGCEMFQPSDGSTEN